MALRVFRAWNSSQFRCGVSKQGSPCPPNYGTRHGFIREGINTSISRRLLTDDTRRDKQPPPWCVLRTGENPA